MRLSAPPVEGEANAALVRFLGRALHVPPTSIKILRGVSSRDKLLHFEGLAADTLRQKLEATGA